VSITVLGGEDCNDGSMLLCVTTLASQRAYLLALPGDDAAFLTAAYRLLLHRAPDSAGSAYYRAELARGAITRDGIIDRMAASAEYRTLHP
jgi:hypothetical protein